MRTLRWIAILSALWLGSGCSKSVAPLHFYTLVPSHRVAIKQSPYRHKVLKVAYPASMGMRINDKLVYTYDDNVTGTYLNSRWADNLGAMLQRYGIETLRDTGAFGAVLPETSGANGDLRLESTVYDFSHHIDASGSYAVVSIDMTLIDAVTGRLLKSKRFSYKVATKSVDAEGYVTAVRRILVSLSQDVVVWILDDKS